MTLSPLEPALIEDARSLTLGEFFARHGHWPPIAGADGADDDGDDDRPADDADQNAPDDAADDHADQDAPDDADDAPDDADDDADEDRVILTKAEHEALRRKIAESEKNARAKERALKQAQERERKRQGQFETLYNEEKEKREGLEGSMKRKALKASILGLAGRLNFRNPALIVDMFTAPGSARMLDAQALVDEDLEVDEHEVEKALNALAKTDAYLVRQKTAQRDQDTKKKPRTNGQQPGSDEDKTQWNPAETMRSAYAETSG